MAVQSPRPASPKLHSKGDYNDVVRFLLGVLASLPLLAVPLSLRSTAWTVTVEPSTLAVSARLPDGRDLSISAAQPDLGAVSELAHGEAKAWHWKLPAKNIAVAVAVAANRFTVRFTTDRPGRFAWPVYGMPDESVSYILPYGEGMLLSPREPVWQSRVWPRHLDTMENFSLPLWGVMGKGWTLTYLMQNPFDGTFSFRDTPQGISWRLEHEFKRHWKEKEFGFDILLGPESPIEPARQYRRLLIESGQFVSMQQKIARTPDAEKLLGAAHAYLWSLGALGLDDVKDWKALDKTGKSAANRFEQRRILAALDEQIRSDPRPEMVARAKARLFEAHPGAFTPVAGWGDAISAKMFGRLKAIGLDRMWLGVSGSAEVKGLRDAVAAGVKAGYLLGPYDSYDSIHSPGEKDTWATAQFDRELFEKGAVVGADGKKVAGFQKKGYWLSSIAARTNVERRVTQTFTSLSFNSFFMDCDASGFLHDNYSAAFLTTQADDMRERLSRMQWIVDRYKTPIGSEDGHWYAAQVIHFAHGMMSAGAFGFPDPRFHDKRSPYYLGGYWPPHAPAIFMKPAPLPEDYRAIYFDPRWRLPLFQAVFHDSVITTQHWSRPSLKFPNVAGVNELLELLYNIPPLYHLNPEELAKHGQAMARHYRFFSPLHRQTGLLPLDDFTWLTPDRMVQRSTFGGQVEMIANFGSEVFRYGNLQIPARGITARHIKSGRAEVYIPLQD